MACGGSVTGEHGIGVEKIDFMREMFTADDLDAMGRLREAFNPDRPAEPRQDASHGRRLRPGTNTSRPHGPPFSRSAFILPHSSLHTYFQCPR